MTDLSEPQMHEMEHAKQSPPEATIAIRAIFSKATTTIDGGWRISFDCSTQEAEQITKLTNLRNEELMLVVIKQ